MPPGELFDMWELWLRARGKKATQDDKTGPPNDSIGPSSGVYS